MPVMPSPARKQKFVREFFQKRAIGLQTVANSCNNIQFSILMGRRKRQRPYLDRAGEGMGNEKVMIRRRARA